MSPSYSLEILIRVEEIVQRRTDIGHGDILAFARWLETQPQCDRPGHVARAGPEALDPIGVYPTVRRRPWGVVLVRL